MKRAIKFIIGRLLAGEKDLRSIKTRTAKKYSLPCLPKNSEITAMFPKSKLTREIFQLLKRKPVRTISGVTPLAVMVKPAGSCRHGCIYCPFTGKAAKSYTGEEPAALRARSNFFDPGLQVGERLRQFFLGGHPSEKCEIIVMGGTFLEMPKEYKYNFVKEIYDALNQSGSRSLNLSKKRNESAKHRAVGLTIETRPDVCGKKEINEMLEFGATRVELGVQNPDDKIYKKINRGHGVKDVTDATLLLKDSAFKVAYHIMPGLPGSGPKKDMEMIKRLFDDERFKPDMLKIYPTLVMPDTELHRMMSKGRYRPYDAGEAADVISEFYRYIPGYVRVMRIQRDIPSNLIAGGVKKSNLRELVEENIREKKITPNEIRWREAGFAKDTNNKSINDFELRRLDYKASKGNEVFLSFEDGSTIGGFIRLRAPFSPFRDELKGAALVREFHVYGEEAGISQKGSVQHRGLGSMLLAEAERIAREELDSRKIAAISGVGAREYFYKKGYKPDGPYVSRPLAR